MWLAAAVAVVAAAGFVSYKFGYEPTVNAPVPPTLRLPTTAPGSGSPGFDNALGQWQHIGTRAEDPEPLTITGLYPPQFILNGSSYVRTAASVTKTCSLAVYGADLQAALQSGHCTQVLRASYISGDGKLMGTVGVVNLISSSAAQKAGQVTGPQEIIAPLTGKKGATSKLGSGTGVVQAEVKGHYLILMWAEFANLKSPSGSAQRQTLEQFAAEPRHWQRQHQPQHPDADRQTLRQAEGRGGPATDLRVATRPPIGARPRYRAHQERCFPTPASLVPSA